MKTKEPKQIEKININLWDDYYDDGYVPKNEIQETDMYIESDISGTLEKEVMDFIFNHLHKYKLLNVKTYRDFSKDFNDERIYFENLTHVQRNELVKNLKKDKLKYKGITLYIYSSS